MGNKQAKAVPSSPPPPPAEPEDEPTRERRALAQSLFEKLATKQPPPSNVVRRCAYIYTMSMLY